MARACVCLLVALTVLTGCGGPGPTVVDDDRAYDRAGAVKLLETPPPADLAGEPVADAPELRHDVLVKLRRGGPTGAEAADLLTRTFASDVTAVPYYVERGRYDGRQAWFVLEALGRQGGELTDRRLWVLDDDGEVLFSGTR